MGFYPDIDQTKTNLCWAAACANALTYAGWNPVFGASGVAELYTMFAGLFPQGVLDQTYWPLSAVRDLIKDRGIAADPLDIIKQRPPYDFPLIEPLIASGGCAILQMDLYYGSTYVNSHALTAYDASYDNNFSSKDPRRVTRLTYVDSEDSAQAIYEMSVTYNPIQRIYLSDYHGPTTTGSRLPAWYSVSHIGR